MCEHGDDIREIKDSLLSMVIDQKTMSNTHVDLAKSLAESARSQAKMVTEMAVYREKLLTIEGRGCEKGGDMVTRAHRRMDDEFRDMKKDIVEPLQNAIASLNNSNGHKPETNTGFNISLKGIIAIGTLIGSIIVGAIAIILNLQSA